MVDRTFVLRRLLPATVAVPCLLAAALVFTASIQASDSGRTASGCAPGAARSLVTSTQTYAADVRGFVRVHRKPGGPAFARFGRLNANGVPTVFAALSSVVGARCKAAWYRVMLPLKPHGQVGYVRAGSVRLRLLRARVVVDLSTRRLTVFERGKPRLRATVAIGARATPTPVGSFYVNQRFRDDPSGPYGWAAIGISAFSEVLHGWPQGGPVAIHGTNRPSLLGLPVSNGCIRVSNSTVRRLWRLAPTGTPVLVQV
jgi:lipoprotein-anchoring transpeptidase ErfK/SrfK